jgi:hypothetical protein
MQSNCFTDSSTNSNSFLDSINDSDDGSITAAHNCSIAGADNQSLSGSIAHPIAVSHGHSFYGSLSFSHNNSHPPAFCYPNLHPFVIANDHTNISTDWGADNRPD